MTTKPQSTMTAIDYLETNFPTLYSSLWSNTLKGLAEVAMRNYGTSKTEDLQRENEELKEEMRIKTINNLRFIDTNGQLKKKLEEIQSSADAMEIALESALNIKQLWGYERIDESEEDIAEEFIEEYKVIRAMEVAMTEALANYRKLKTK